MSTMGWPLTFYHDKDNMSFAPENVIEVALKIESLMKMGNYKIIDIDRACSFLKTMEKLKTTDDFPFQLIDPNFFMRDEIK